MANHQLTDNLAHSIRTEIVRQLGASATVREDDGLDIAGANQTLCCVAVATAAIAAMDGWLPIESAPRDGSDILAAMHDGPAKHYQRVVWWDEKLGAWVDGSADSLGDPYTEEPTHYRPLPTPPAAAGSER